MIPLDFGWLPLEIVYSAVGFVVLMSVLPGLIAITSGSLTVAAVPVYVMFAWQAMHSGIELLDNVLLATTVLMVLGFAFKIWRLEGMAE